MNKSKEQYRIKHNKFIKTLSDISKLNHNRVKRELIINQITYLSKSEFIKVIKKNIDTLNEFKIGLYDINIYSRSYFIYKRENINDTISFIKSIKYIDESKLNFLSNSKISYDDVACGLRYINDIKLSITRDVSDMPVLEKQNAIELIDLEIIKKLEVFKSKDYDDLLPRTQSIISKYLFEYLKNKNISSYLDEYDCYFAFKLKEWNINKLKNRFNNGSFIDSLYGMSFMSYAKEEDLKKIFFNGDKEIFFPHMENFKEFLDNDSKAIARMKHLVLNKFLCKRLKRLKYFDMLLDISYSEFNKENITKEKINKIAIIADNLSCYHVWIEFDKEENRAKLLYLYLMSIIKFQRLDVYSRSYIKIIIERIKGLSINLDWYNFIKNINFTDFDIESLTQKEAFITLMRSIYKDCFTESSYEFNAAFIEKVISVVGVNNRAAVAILRYAKNINDEVISKCSGINSEFLKVALKNKRIKAKDKTYLKLISTCG